MINIFINRKSKSRFLIIFFLLGTLTLTSCEPLRKKFLRQKKKDQQSVDALNPIIEPIDYPEKVYSVSEEYKQHYSLWQVWERELLVALEDKSTIKRENYMLTQIITQLEEMNKLLPVDKQNKLSEIIEQYKSLKIDWEESRQFGNTTSVKLKLAPLGKKVREGYRFNIVKEGLVQKN